METRVLNLLAGLGLVCAVQLVAASPASHGKVSVNLIPSGKIDLEADSITLPLHQGALKDGRRVWFVITDADDADTARNLGIAYSPDLSNAAKARSTRTGTTDVNGRFTFDAGTVDFKPTRHIVPGASPNFFPPAVATPGSVGDLDYSPYVRITNEGDTVYNAPILAFDVDAKQISFCNGNVNHDLVHDKVVKICPEEMEVTLALSHGFADSKPVVYVSFDANVELAAAMEASTLVPSFTDLKNTGASLDIYALANGETGKNNIQRQGFDSALSGDGSPLNILDGLPSVDSGYSPLWALYLGAWTDQAIQIGSRKLLTSTAEVLQDVRKGLVTGPGGSTFDLTGILINCPVVAILQ